MPIGSPQWMYASGEDFTVDQSLKFNDNDSAYLSRTPASASNRRTWTFSAWVKSSSMSTADSGNSSSIFEAFENNDNRVRLYFDDGNNPLSLYCKIGGTITMRLLTNAVYRDFSAWYHIVLAVDTTQGTDTNRVKLYVNGEQITSFSSSTYPSQNVEHAVNNTNVHHVGAGSSGSSIYAGTHFDGYLAEVHFIDGTALTPTSFGESGDYGEWKPKEVSGLTYGTNGFYLPFKSDYEVEGFSAVTWKGNAADQYVGGVGFSPDLVWGKCRDTASTPHEVIDTVRGTSKRLQINSTGAETTASNDGFVSISNDGFLLDSSGGGGNFNGSGRQYVAWNWDMGANGGGNPKVISVADGGVLSTSEKKFGTASLSLDGANRHYTSPQHDDFSFGTGDFTVECWIYQDGSANYDGIITFQGHASTYSIGYGIGYNASNHINWVSHLGNVTTVVTHDAALSDSVWHHIAVSRSSGVTKLFINGTEEDSATDTNDYQNIEMSSIGVSIGRYYPTVDEKYFDGYMDEIRISNSARYTSSFSVATSAHTKDVNTVLLMHCDGADASTVIKDHSSSDPNTDGTIESSVQANTTYGQSIVSYAGNSTAGATIGHGLSSAPEMIIVKNRTSSGSWVTYHTSLGNTKGLNLASNGTPVTSAVYWNNTSPTASLFSVGFDGAGHELNQSTKNYIAYCFHSVTGYSKFGSYTGNGGSGTITVTTGFKPAWIMVKRTDSTSDWSIFDTTRQPSGDANNVLDESLAANLSNAVGTDNDFAKLTDTSFIVQANDYGFCNASGGTYIYAAFADKREYAYWLDQSGNNNDWTSNNLTESDISVDSPTNNFCTVNPVYTNNHQHIGALSEGNLKHSYSDNNDAGAGCTMSFQSGKWYWEWLVVAGGNSSNWQLHSGILDVDQQGYIAGRRIWNVAGAISYEPYSQLVKKNTSDATDYGSTPAINGDILMCAVDQDNGAIYFGKNGSWFGTGDPTSGASKTGAGATWTVASEYSHIVPFSSPSGGGTPIQVMNFGQDSSFAGNKTAQGNQDGNDIGDFYYEPPSGFLALCTSNLPAVAVTPSEHFDVALYTGDGASTQAVTTNFEPDLIWNKMRGEDLNHRMYDRVRGFANQINSNQAYEENKYTDYGHPTATSSTSVTIGQGTDSGNLINASSDAGVLWNWKAGNETLGTGDFTQGAIASTCSRNVDAGFSIVSYTGTGSASNVGHGLSSAPEMIIVKNRDAADSWAVWHPGLASIGYHINLDTYAPQQSGTGVWDDQFPTSSRFYVKTDHKVNANTEKYIAYCFHSVDGYSKVGTYTGNANADGPFVYTGFRPAYVMAKNASADTGSGNGDWNIFDTTRSTYNPMDDRLRANDSTVEGGSSEFIDFLSNGFKPRYTGEFNQANKVIYLAFAETPFKYSNAR